MTLRSRVIFSRRFQTNDMFQHLGNRESGDVASYLKVNETHIHPCENIQAFIFHAILKCVNFLSGTSGNESPLYTVLRLYDSRPNNGLSG